MQTAEKNDPSKPARRWGFVFPLLVLGGMLGVLFIRSFEPHLIVFANDGPLGAVKAEPYALPSALFGIWNNLNWVGAYAGSASADLTYLIMFLLGPLGFAKFDAPLSLLILGLSAWGLFRQLGFRPTVCTLCAAAGMFNTDFFSYACWGLGTHTLAIAWVFLALAALVTTATKRAWLKASLAGMAVGASIVEGFDSGAILSLYIAIFVLFLAWVEAGRPLDRISKGLGRLTLVAGFAAFLAAQALTVLIGTSIKGVVGMEQDQQTKAQHWDYATQWSLPKVEALRIIIPGLFGYRMDTSDGGNYWGAVGQTPGVIQSRFSGAGFYGGVLVLLVAAWAGAQSLRGRNSLFKPEEKKQVWFWSIALVVSLLLAFGRHAPFYQFFYALPYFSTIRNPVKFMHPFGVALVILFGFGLQVMWRTYVERGGATSPAFSTQFKTWWTRAPAFDRKWAAGSLLVFGISVVGWLLYRSSRASLETYLAKVGFPGEMGAAIATFSFAEVGWFVCFLALAIGVTTLIVSGSLSGARAKWAGILLVGLLFADSGRANRPWIVYWNYREKYAINPIIDVLRDKPYEQRVQMLPPSFINDQIPTLLQQYGSKQVQDLFEYYGRFQNLYGIEWVQHLFLFYNVQSLDVIQEPRMAADNAAFRAAFAPCSTFVSGHIKDLRSFATRLQRHSEPVSQLLWDRFSETTRQKLADSNVANTDSRLLQAALVQELGAISRGNSIYEPKRFAGVRLSEETRRLLERSPKGEALERLNLLLLLDAYPAELRNCDSILKLRLLQLTNTRFLLGFAGASVDLLNQQLDPLQRRFRVHTPFALAYKNQSPSKWEDFTVTLNSNGPLALVEFSGALPRAKLYANWKVSTNQQATLSELADPTFDPWQTVLVAGEIPNPAPTNATNQPAGAVEIKSYASKRVVIEANAAQPSVLLLNDKFDPNWRVWVDGHSAELFRCNFLMRGVYLEPGKHTVEYLFEPPITSLYVSLAAIVLAIGLCGFLAFSAKGHPVSPATDPTAPPAQRPRSGKGKPA